MCGIFGYISDKSPTGLLTAMGELLLHRGPDDVGYYSDEQNQTHFGLRRLSIIDLEGGHQPLSNEDGTTWVACNGEIYNYIELRADLEQKGHRFKTVSDVETLVHLYEEHGLDFLKDVNGMFGLVLYDRRRQRLVLARDRIGIKPVYYSYRGGKFAFASEIKPLLRCPWISREPDWKALSAYLHLFYIPAPGTGFADIEKLPAGCLAVAEKGDFSLRSYWRLDEHAARETYQPTQLNEAAGELRTLIADACRLQLRSDVPVGAFLSGGIDSSAVVRFSSSADAANMDTYTIGWKDAAEKMDERVYAREVAAQCHCRYNETRIAWPDFDRLLPKLVWHLEEPNADGAYVPTYLISKYSSKKSKVILTGAGGDELFGGYGHYRLNSRVANALQALLPGGLPAFQQAPYRNRAFMFPWPLVFPSYKYGRAVEFMKIFDEFESADRLRREMVVDLKVYLQDNILLLTDKMSMAASVEARVPLLDHRILELVAGLPSGLKLNHQDTKIVLKTAMRGFLPDSILQRRKDGFGAPIHSWMQGEFQAIARSLLDRGHLKKNGLIAGRHLTNLDRLIRLKPHWSWALWVLLNLELWFRFVVEDQPCPTGVRLSSL